ncbi:hypothetical protein V499_03086 [Pseudogymnoascus sp. VKM F-103]|uniref:FAD-binding domain-containing protein n=1 Tax=Pseudogymnoascus verrucosus TaxID=342668 RepID=A0A1B8GCE8_9PEZI|nr:uncharacterized protein VE01_08655 [Pseudogymnoascus verrucosus]KFY77573.1 hypothetical protein V499_03086 [Pseudogymnoascus sp. VKM F-103]OBT93457.1 hypothetical protein VE01_08655 [Pseudogymnoascus verrucosus]
MSEDIPFRVLVIGAGITGLLIAQGLKKEGIACTVFESEPSASHYRAAEWGMSIQWGIPLLQQCLPEALFDRLQSVATDPYFTPPDPGLLPTLNGKTGELLKDVPLLRMFRVSRRRFRSLCAEGISVEYDKTLKDVVYDDDKNTVTAIFADSSRAVGSLLVGADGAHSAVRTCIFGPEKGRASSVPYSAVNICVKYNDAEKARFVRQLHPIMAMGIHPDGHWLWISIQSVPDPNDPATWSFQLQTTSHKGKDDVMSLENLKKKAATFAEPFRSANLWIPEGTPIHENKISYWMPIPWDDRNGRITLAGDAAHPMTFQRGQGMNHGIADAASLVTKLKSALDGHSSVKDAVKAYNTEMIERAGDEVATSKENTEMLHDWSRMMDSPIMQKGGHPRSQQPPAVVKR